MPDPGRRSIKFSLVVCSYNPSEQLFVRCLAGCARLLEKHPESELIIVDNNSEPPLASKQAVEALIATNPRAKAVIEPKQGLSFARIRGLRESCGEVIVFADDDNVLASDYLFSLDNLFREYPHVGVWGPGEVEPEFIGKEKRWIRKHFGHLYQEKHFPQVQFGSEPGWPSYYPAGSGMSTRREVLERYAEGVEAGRLNATGRKGSELTSGEDAQLVWTAVLMGMCAGTSPAVRLSHLIAPQRQSLGYLQKLQRQIASSHYKAFVEMFPERAGEMRPLSFAGYIKLAASLAVKAGFDPLLWYRRFAIKVAWFRGIREAHDQLA